MIQLTITENEEQQRLDRFLKKYFKNAPLSRIYKMIRKDVKVNGKRVAEDHQLENGDLVAIYISQEEADLLARRKENVKAKRQFKIVYEDENILLVEKPYGLLIHGDRTEKKNTLANQVVDYLIETGSYVPRREKTFIPSPVNRLDRNTTGIVIFGKNNLALQCLNQMLRERSFVEKYYLTVVRGQLREELHLKDYLWKDEKTNQVKIQEEGGKEVETKARPLRWACPSWDRSPGSGFTLVEVHLITGRTHQIRAHLANAGYPVVGDEKYGDARINRVVQERYGLSSQFLHAYRLRFADALPPLEYLKGREFTAPLPPLLTKVEGEIFDGEANLRGTGRRPGGSEERGATGRGAGRGTGRQSRHGAERGTGRQSRHGAGQKDGRVDDGSSDGGLQRRKSDAVKNNGRSLDNIHSKYSKNGKK